MAFMSPSDDTAITQMRHIRSCGQRQAINKPCYSWDEYCKMAVDEHGNLDKKVHHRGKYAGCNDSEHRKDAVRQRFRPRGQYANEDERA